MKLVNKAIKGYVEEIHYHYDKAWADYQPEIRMLSETLDCGKLKDVPTFINLIRNLPKIKALKKRIENQEQTIQSLMEQTDYLSSQLRLDDADFYDHLENLKKKEALV